MTRKTLNKITTASEAIRDLITDGITLGIGGQTLGRVTMSLAHEIIRQNVDNLTLVGCSMSMSMDILVGAGLVRRTECGTGNLERIGTTMRWRRAIENGELEFEDYSHLGMAARFLAGSLGLPFMPTKSMLGTDILNRKRYQGKIAYKLIDNPWEPGDQVVLVPALNPDVSIIHAQKADPMGNVVIEGFTTHDIEMAKASRAVIVSCEKLVTTNDIRNDPDKTSIPYIYIDAVVEQPWGAYPTSTYRHYVQDEDHLNAYQSVARSGGQAYDDYLDRTIRDHATFDDFLKHEVGQSKLEHLQSTMTQLL